MFFTFLVITHIHWQIRITCFDYGVGGDGKGRLHGGLRYSQYKGNKDKHAQHFIDYGMGVRIQG